MARTAIDTKIVCTECVKVVEIVDELPEHNITSRTRLWLRCHDREFFVYLDQNANTNSWPDRAVLEQLRDVNQTQYLYDEALRLMLHYVREFNFYRRLILAEGKRTMIDKFTYLNVGQRDEIRFTLERLLNNVGELLKELPVESK